MVGGWQSFWEGQRAPIPSTRITDITEDVSEVKQRPRLYGAPVKATATDWQEARPS